MNFLYDHAPTFGLVFFFCVFVVIAFRTYRPSARAHIQSHAFIPLKEEDRYES